MDQSQVGYKNVVSMSHTDDIVLIGDLESNGKIEYTYTNSVDYPDDFLSNTPGLYMPAVSNHFKRGLLTKETVYDRTNHKLNETLIEYDFDEDLLPTGVSIYSIYDDNNVHPVFSLFTNYFEFNNARTNNHCFSQGYYYTYCGLAEALLEVYNNINIYRYISNSKRGWAKQTQVQRLEYPSGTSTAVETNEQFYYNSFNKQISSTVKAYSSSDWEQQTFSYANDLNNQLLIQKNMLVTPLVTQTIKNGQLQSKVETNYIDWGNGLVAPNFVSAAKSNQPLEVKVRYNQIDPITGNPRQVQMENGTYISYIWGYHNSLPVAKLENIAYNDIPAQLITAIQSETDATNYSESSVLTALEALRSSTDPNMQKAMITTYTHKPLIGISTVTDPRGQRQTYIYDDFNRLKEVRDHNDKLLSENEYYYRTQN
jgi:YD repeat-containing protein